jgi:cytoskeletal protein CcmA (bactofilin family)
MKYTIANHASGRPYLRSVSACNHPDGVLRDTVEIFFNNNSYNSFTLFAWMTNFEGNVFWFTGDTIWGRVHSNGQLHMSGTPTFMDKVTTSKGINPKWGTNGNNAVFKQGYETGVAEIPFPTDLAPLFTAATSGGRSYTGNIEVSLNGGTAANNDGYVVVTKAGAVIDSFALSGGGFNGALVSTGRVSVKGVVDGKLTIGSSTEVYVTDNIHYENRTVATTDDVLGLVSNVDVIIADNAANSTGCEVDGSVFARSGKFTAENYNTGSPRGQLKLLGSIVQNSRGAVGTFQNGQNTLKTGFSKHYRYDERLADPTFRPPFYPGFYTKAYTIASWWESVQVPKFN